MPKRNEIIFRMTGATNHSEYDRELLDYYATEPAAVDKLLQAETPYKRIWECACGGGMYPNV